MESPLEAVNRQIQQEKDRHNRVINDLKTKIDRENTQHQQSMRMYNNRKAQIKKTVECFLYEIMNKKHTTLDKMYKLIEKATEDFSY